MVDGPVPDSAMDTKSEEGDPGGVDDSAPLTEDEQALLDHLRDQPAPTGDRPADTGPPAPPRDAGPDPLDPVFREPNP